MIYDSKVNSSLRLLFHSTAAEFRLDFGNKRHSMIGMDTIKTFLNPTRW